MCFPYWSVIPFVALLVAIAVLPTLTPRWWDNNANKIIVSVVASLPVLAVVLQCDPALLQHSLLDYFSFVTLIGSLFVISSGIYIRGEFAGTPLENALFLATGALLSNVIGSTGASILLVRPYMRANHARQHKTHLMVFFIFIVSNIGGLLIPLGNPPFLGFLRGVPFLWTLRLWPQWALALGILLIVFILFDRHVFRQEEIATHGQVDEDILPRRALEVRGAINIFYLFGVMTAAILSGYFGWPRGIQEAIIFAMILLSWFTTPRAVHEANHFSLHPIAEVAALFLGIFVTMIPTLEILNARAHILNITQPWQFFWLSGGLSSFLDNAPTYLTFASLASGLSGGGAQDFRILLDSRMGSALLAAVSCGAVFMGANTYVGNGPNFMVKSIAEHHGMKMPSFFGYMLYTFAILIPLFIIETAVFFRN
jgi:Na+/H+ antiporter NhaD/arsenite permease-like protein